jgi:hypothetical protein
MTSAVELVRLAIAFEARLWIDDDRLELDVPADFPAGLVLLLREHKAEVLGYLRQHPIPAETQYRLKYPRFPQASDQELAEILQTVQQRGFVLVWSTNLNDLVAFHRPELDLHLIPPGFVPYSTRELAVLFSQDVEPPSTEGLRLIHEAKKYGGRIDNHQARESS